MHLCYPQPPPSGLVVQLVEERFFAAEVVGSNPTGVKDIFFSPSGPISLKDYHLEGIIWDVCNTLHFITVN